MMVKQLAILVFVSLATSGPTSAKDQPWKAGWSGLGPVRIGMTAAELSAALHQPIEPPGDADEAVCRYVDDAKKSGVGYMLVRGVVARIGVDSPSRITTVSGIAVGDSIDRVRARYGAALEEKPHAYSWPPDLYLTYWSSDRRFAVRFETGDGRVTRYYVGRTPEVEYIEGCL